MARPAGPDTPLEAAVSRDRERPPLGRWVTEVFVITLGILLAFGVDAAWSEVQEAEAERLALEALRGEFQANKLELTRIAARHAHVADAGRELLRLTGPDAVGSDEASRLIGEVWVPWEARLATGAISSLISTDGLARIEDDALQRALVAWPEEAAAFRNLEIQLAGISQDRLVPLLQETVSQVNIELVNGFSGIPNLRDEFRRTVERSRFQGDVGVLLRELEFENVVLHRVTISMIAEAEAGGLVQTCEEILAMVEASLQ